MEPEATLPPIPGERVDPPAAAVPARLRLLESRPGVLGAGTGVAVRAVTRFTAARGTLLAAGTTYYLFLSLFSVLALGYGVAAALGAERLAAYLTEALSAAFPGVVGQGGIDPEQLRGIGQTTSLVSAVGLLYGATGAVLAGSRSLHAVYGAPHNPRNAVAVRVWSLGWFLALAPLVLLSFVASTFTANLSARVLGALGVQWSGPPGVITVVALLLTLALNFLVVLIALGRLGGIRPPRRPRLVGAAVGAVVIEVLKQAMALLVGFVIDKPQYAAVAAPIGILFVLYLQSTALYAVAALTAALAERAAGSVGPDGRRDADPSPGRGDSGTGAPVQTA
ncbi:MAG TPA: YhjD/YihY/BrkB family envelope integrity protein [Phycicoccus sp.]